MNSEIDERRKQELARVYQQLERKRQYEEDVKNGNNHLRNTNVPVLYSSEEFMLGERGRIRVSRPHPDEAY